MECSFQSGYDCEMCGKKVNSRSDLNNHLAWWDTLGGRHMNKNHRYTILQHRSDAEQSVRCVAKMLIVEAI